jgi:hypothetical protein
MNILLDIQEKVQGIALSKNIRKKLETLKNVVDESTRIDPYFNFDQRAFAPVLIVSEYANKNKYSHMN